MMILMTVMTAMIMVRIMTEEKRRIAMMTAVQEEVEIMTNPGRGSEAGVRAAILDQGEADPGTEDQDTLLQYRRCRLWTPRNITSLETLLSFATTLKNGENCWTPPTTPLHRE